MGEVWVLGEKGIFVDTNALGEVYGSGVNHILDENHTWGRVWVRENFCFFVLDGVCVLDDFYIGDVYSTFVGGYIYVLYDKVYIEEYIAFCYVV